MALADAYEITGAGLGNGIYVYQGEIPAGYFRFDLLGEDFKLMYHVSFPRWYIGSLNGSLLFYTTVGSSSTTADDPYGYTWTVGTHGVLPAPFTPVDDTPTGNMLLMF